MIARGVAQPYTWTLLGTTFLSMPAIPLFCLASRRFAQERDRLFEREQQIESKARTG